VAQGERRTTTPALEIEQGEAAQEQLLVDHALAQARGDAEADALGQRLDDITHVTLVAGGERGQAIAHHHPVDRPSALDGPQLALLPHRFGIDRRPHDLERVRIDARQQVEVDETVVERRQQRIGPDMRGAREVRVAAGRVDDHEVGSSEHRLQCRLEARLFVGFRRRTIRQG